MTQDLWLIERAGFGRGLTGKGTEVGGCESNSGTPHSAPFQPLLEQVMSQPLGSFFICGRPIKEKQSTLLTGFDSSGILYLSSQKQTLHIRGSSQWSRFMTTESSSMRKENLNYNVLLCGKDATQSRAHWILGVLVYGEGKVWIKATQVRLL